MKTLAAFQLVVGLVVFLTAWALGPFAFTTRSVVVFALMAVAVLTGPTLLVLGSVLVFFSKTRGSGGTLGLVGWLLSSAWLIYILANIVLSLPSHPLNSWVVVVALLLLLAIITSFAAAIRLYRMSHGERHSKP